MYSFGSGVLIGTRTDIDNATPLNFGLVQEVTIDEQAGVKELYGQYQYPLAVARGTIKTTGKAKVARISGLAFANLYYGLVPAAGQVATSLAEADTVPASTPYTVSVANTANFVCDAGVLYAASGLPLTKVASSPSVGQYSVADGVYTFNASDAGKAVLVTYTYTIASGGQKFTVANQLIGTTPTPAWRLPRPIRCNSRREEVLRPMQVPVPSMRRSSSSRRRRLSANPRSGLRRRAARPASPILIGAAPTYGSR